MDNRDTLLSAQFPHTLATEAFVEADLRDLSGRTLIGQRGQLQFMTKLVFKAAESYRQTQSVVRLWADVQAQSANGMPLPDLGRAVIPDPIFFAPQQDIGPRSDPWTRSFDRLVLDVDFRQLDEIELIRQGGQLTFIVKLGGVAYYEGKIGTLYPANHTLLYQVGASDWQQVLNQLTYGTYVNLEIPLTSPNGLTGNLQLAADALSQAVAAFRRGEYEEAVADCRPGLNALEDADKGKFSLKPWDRAADSDERFSWVQHALLTLANLAHHPNDPAAADNTSAVHAGWKRSDAEAVISVLASLIRRRLG